MFILQWIIAIIRIFFEEKNSIKPTMTEEYKQDKRHEYMNLMGYSNWKEAEDAIQRESIDRAERRKEEERQNRVNTRKNRQ